MSRFCEECGTALTPADRFCTECGTRVDVAESSAEPEPAAPAEPVATEPVAAGRTATPAEAAPLEVAPVAVAHPDAAPAPRRQPGRGRKTAWLAGAALVPLALAALVWLLWPTAPPEVESVAMTGGIPATHGRSPFGAAVANTPQPPPPGGATNVPRPAPVEVAPEPATARKLEERPQTPAPGPAATTPAPSPSPSSPSAASPPSLDPVRVRGSRMTMARVVDRWQPALPEWAREAGLPRYVVLELVIDRTGRLRSSSVLRPAHPELDRLAIEAVTRWTFAPATRDGEPVDSYFNVSVQFESS